MGLVASATFDGAPDLLLPELLDRFLVGKLPQVGPAFLGAGLDFRGQEIRRQLSRRPQHHHALDGIAKLADVPRPGVPPHDVESLLGELQGLAFHLPDQPVQKHLAQDRHVLRALAKGRNGEVDHVEPEVEVLPESPFLHLLLQVLVGCGDHPAVDVDGLVPTHPLELASYHSPLDDAFALDQEEIAALSMYAKKLAGQLVGLADSRRPDWGQTFLVGMARLSALNRSIESGHLIFLDSFPEDSPALGHASLDRRRDISLMMLSENQKQFEASRAYFRKAPALDELAWERLEERSNRYFEMLRALRGDLSIRVARGHLVPSRAAPYPVPVWPWRSGERLSEDLAQVEVRDRSYSNAMQRLHRYRLLSQNCATAIFETLNDSFEDSVEISEQRLGGYIGSRHSLAFIPFVSAIEVNDRYRVIQRETILSYRQLRLQTMKHEESTMRVALRESNTLTSTTYRRNSNDSFFVFVTEDAPLLRPLFGAVNLTAALGESVLGILAAPVDRGAILIRGLRGTFVSLPELVFGNIRKGSNDWIPKQHRSLDPVIVKAE